MNGRRKDSRDFVIQLNCFDMTREQADNIVNRMVSDARKKYTGLPGYENSYILGSLEGKLQFLLVQSNFDYEQFNEAGEYPLLPLKTKKK